MKIRVDHGDAGELLGLPGETIVEVPDDFGTSTPARRRAWVRRKVETTLLEMLHDLRAPTPARRRAWVRRKVETTLLEMLHDLRGTPPTPRQEAAFLRRMRPAIEAFMAPEAADPAPHGQATPQAPGAHTRTGGEPMRRHRRRHRPARWVLGAIDPLRVIDDTIGEEDLRWLDEWDPTLCDRLVASACWLGSLERQYAGIEAPGRRSETMRERRRARCAFDTAYRDARAALARWIGPHPGEGP
jgi:hypothetical protein